MKIKFVIPNMEKTFGIVEFGSFKEVKAKRARGQTVVESRMYHLFSSIQTADNVEVILPGDAGEKNNFEYGDRVELINPRIEAEGDKAGSTAYTDYKLYADDMKRIQ